MKRLKLARGLTLIGFVTITILNTGCVTNGRRVLLKEYGPTIQEMADLNLQGTTVCVKGFTSVPDLVIAELESEPIEPEGFQYQKLTKEHDELWSAEMKQLQKTVPESEWIAIGNMRNGFGMVMSHVYALNDPAEWLAQSLVLDLESLGATVVGADQEDQADVVVSGTVEVCRADMYMTVNGTLLVNLTVQTKGEEARHRKIHTHGATAAMLASEGEYFHALRDCRQKFSIFTAQEIAQAVGAN